MVLQLEPHHIGDDCQHLHSQPLPPELRRLTVHLHSVGLVGHAGERIIGLHLREVLLWVARVNAALMDRLHRVRRLVIGSRQVVGEVIALRLAVYPLVDDRLDTVDLRLA